MGAKLRQEEEGGGGKPVGFSVSPLPRHSRAEKLLLAAFVFSGAAALVYEVIWSRILSFVFGSTVYSLSIILAVFMGGLGLGGWLGGRLAARRNEPFLYFGLLEIGIGVFGLLSVPVIYHMPPFFFELYKSYHLSAGSYFLSQAALCIGVMLVPTTLMGATFPIVARGITEGTGELGREVGAAYRANTAGAIAGSLAGGFLLIPLIGPAWSAWVAAAMNLGVASLMLIWSGKIKSRVAVAAGAVLLLAAGGVVSSGAEMAYPTLTFYHAGKYADEGTRAEDLRHEEILARWEYATGTVLVRKGSMGLITIQTGGRSEGTGPSDVSMSMYLAVLPEVIMERQPERTLLIGLGAGVTSWAARKVTRELEVVEISAGVVEAVRKFGLEGSLEGARVHVADGRLFILGTDKTYDTIISGTSVPSESMSSHLFTRQYYEQAAGRLRKNGVFVQQISAWTMTRKDAWTVFKTLASVFPHTAVWYPFGAGGFIAAGSNEPFDRSVEEIATRAENRLRELLPPVWSREALAAGAKIPEEYYTLKVIRGPERMRELLDNPDIPLITDDRPLIEFAVARNLIYGRNFRELRKE